MQVRIAEGAAGSVATGALVLPVFADKRLDGDAAAIDAALDGALGAVLAAGEIAGKPNELALVHASKPYQRVVLVGLGERSVPRRRWRRPPERWSAFARERNVAKIAFVLPAEAAADPHAQHRRSPRARLQRPSTRRPIAPSPTSPSSPTKRRSRGFVRSRRAASGVARGIALGEAINHARLMALTPGNDMTPTILAERARSAPKPGLEVTVLDEAAGCRLRRWARCSACRAVRRNRRRSP